MTLFNTKKKVEKQLVKEKFHLHGGKLEIWDEKKRKYVPHKESDA